MGQMVTQCPIHHHHDSQRRRSGHPGRGRQGQLEKEAKSSPQPVISKASPSPFTSAQHSDTGGVCGGVSDSFSLLEEGSQALVGGEGLLQVPGCR